MLAGRRPWRELRRLARTRHGAAGGLIDQRRELWVWAQRPAGRDRVGVQVEQAAAAADRHGEVAQVGQRQLAGDVLRTRAQRYHAGAVRQPERTAVGTVTPLLDTWYRRRR